MNRPASPIYAPSLLEKVFSLRRVRPFDRLPADELALLAEVARARSYGPGEAIHSGEMHLSRLLVIAAGRAVTPDGTDVGPIAGVASLVKQALAPPILADPVAGACVLAIDRTHFFTLARECPEFVLGLIELGEHGQPAETP
jgi:signal-transduction protein with cAMP-binding, CBS, and nucleotidyltransferase domain